MSLCGLNRPDTSFFSGCRLDFQHVRKPKSASDTKQLLLQNICSPLVLVTVSFPVIFYEERKLLKKPRSNSRLWFYLMSGGKRICLTFVFKRRCMPEKFILALDQGTTSSRAILF